MKKKVFMLLCALPLLLCSCKEEKSEPQPQPDPEPTEMTARFYTSSDMLDLCDMTVYGKCNGSAGYVALKAGTELKEGVVDAAADEHILDLMALLKSDVSKLRVYTYTYTPDNTEQYFKIGYKRTTKAATQNVLVLRGANVNTGVSHISADNNITEAAPDECTQELIDIFFSSDVLVFKR